MKWHDSIFFGLHFDIHANETDTELGAGLTEEHLIEELCKVRPDYVHCDCKGHPGYSSYPTGVGVSAPGIVKDSLKIWRSATKKLGIPLIMHFSGIWDTQAIKAHPEWARVNSPKAKKSSWPVVDFDDFYLDKNMVCPISSYTTDYMAKQMIEIIDKYEVDGFWVDGENWAIVPCYCEKCKHKFTQETGISIIPEAEGDPNWDKWLKFHRENFEQHVRIFTDLIHNHKPDCTVCSNWMYTLRQPDSINVPIDYISGDFNWIWSTYSANAEARYMNGRGKSWDLMAWGFTSYGPMKDWVFKSVASLCQEAAVVMSCGGAFMIYDQPERAGNLVPFHMDKIAEVARFCRIRQAYCQNTKSIPQVAILHSKNHFYYNNQPVYNFGTALRPLEGALQVLLENHVHVDIFSECDLFDKIALYPIWVIPEQSNLDDQVIAIFKNYVKNGGNLIISGANETSKFDDILGIEDSGDIEEIYAQRQLYLPIKGETVCAMGKWRKVLTKNSTSFKSLLNCRDVINVKDHIVGPAIVKNTYKKGNVFGIMGSIFENYNVSRYPHYRGLIGEIIEQIDENLIKVSAPPCVHITFREKNNMILLNFINHSTDHPLSAANAYIENVPFAGPIEVEIILDKKPKFVYCAPDFQPVDWHFSNGVIKAKISNVGIHNILVIEK